MGFKAKKPAWAMLCQKHCSGLGVFIQHKRSGLRTSPQVTDCDSKVLAKCDTDILKDEMHGTTTSSPRSSRPGGQKEKPSSTQY